MTKASRWSRLVLPVFGALVVLAIVPAVIAAIRVESLKLKVDSMYQGTSSFIIDDPTHGKIALGVGPGQSADDVLTVAVAFLEGEETQEVLTCVEVDSWADENGTKITVITTQGVNESKPDFEDRHAANILAAQRVVDCEPE